MLSDELGSQLTSLWLGDGGLQHQTGWIRMGSKIKECRLGQTGLTHNEGGCMQLERIGGVVAACCCTQGFAPLWDIKSAHLLQERCR